MADLNQFINKDLALNDVSHSSGIGSVAGGGGAGGLSIDRRRELMNRERIIGSYHHSRLGRRGSSVKSRTADQPRSRVYDANSDTFGDGGVYANRKNGSIKNRNQVDTKSVERRRFFIEPPSRKYDKYS